MTSIPTRKIEMKTVQQMLDLKPTTLCPALYKWSIKAAAMLRTQAAEIEFLKVEYVKELDKVSERNYSLRKENEALKAALNAAATSLNTISRLAGNELYVDEDGERVETYMKHLDQIHGYASSRYGAAIDAMKGKS